MKSVDIKNQIKQIILTSIDVKKSILANDSLMLNIEKSADSIIKCFINKGKILLCGNGGSAADAQHIAAEFSGRFYKDRSPLFAEALHVNTSFITAVANDYSYEEVYSRAVEAKGAKGDILIGISTSGKSLNVIKALNQANGMGMTSIFLTGNLGSDNLVKSDFTLSVDSFDTPRIQECHILIGHIICKIVEDNLFD